MTGKPSWMSDVPRPIPDRVVTLWKHRASRLVIGTVGGEWTTTYLTAPVDWAQNIAVWNSPDAAWDTLNWSL